jgi:hypothetical protein
MMPETLSPAPQWLDQRIENAFVELGLRKPDFGKIIQISEIVQQTAESLHQKYLAYGRENAEKILQEAGIARLRESVSYHNQVFLLFRSTNFPIETDQIKELTSPVMAHLCQLMATQYEGKYHLVSGFSLGSIDLNTGKLVSSTNNHSFSVPLLPNLRIALPFNF